MSVSAPSTLEFSRLLLLKAKSPTNSNLCAIFGLPILHNYSWQLPRPSLCQGSVRNFAFLSSCVFVDNCITVSKMASAQLSSTSAHPRYADSHCLQAAPCLQAALCLQCGLLTHEEGTGRVAPSPAFIRWRGTRGKRERAQSVIPLQNPRGARKEGGGATLLVFLLREAFFRTLSCLKQ